MSLDAVYLNGTLLLGGDLTITGPDTIALPADDANYVTTYGPAGSATSFGLTVLGGAVGGSGTVHVATTSLLALNRVNLNTSVVNQGSAVLLSNNANFTITPGLPV